MSQFVSFAPDTQVELVLDDAGNFLGIGMVSIAGVQLRSAARPILLRLDTPDGILYPRLEFLGIESDANGSARVKLRAHGIHWERGEYGDDYDQTLIWVTPNAEPVVDEVTLLLAPAQLALGGRDWQGFSYAVSFRSDERRIHRLLLHATWEIGGSIAGNTVLSQGQCNMPVYHGAAETLFTTACLRTLDAYGSPQANSFQLGPRAGLVQGFDFQYAEKGALLQYWQDYGSISSLLESPPGSELLHVIDEYRFPLSGEVTTIAKNVLFTPGALAEHEARNLWWDAYHHVYGTIKETYHITPTVVMPESGLGYSTRPHNGRLLVTLGEVEVDSTEAPYAIAEQLLPRLAERGIKRFFPEVMSESDVTADGLRCKLAAGMHGDLHCASVCATRRFFPSDFWGGITAWKYMADKAHELGLEVGAWFAPHFSPRAPIFVEHPEYRMISVTGLPAGGGYGFQTLTVADWNTGIYDWALADLTRWKKEGGLDYLFTDSLSNMGMIQMNYSAEMRTNFSALGRLYGDLQRIGLMSFSFECISAFGVGRFGVADLRGDLMEQNHAVAGQNDFGWWVGEEDMGFSLCLCCSPRKRTPEAVEQIQFRLMANRAFMLFESYAPGAESNATLERLNRLYTQALPDMQHRSLLPNRAGVCWTQGDTRLIWAFQDMPITLDAGTTLTRLDGQTEQEIPQNGQTVLPAWGVYRVHG